MALTFTDEQILNYAESLRGTDSEPMTSAAPTGMGFKPAEAQEATVLDLTNMPSRMQSSQTEGGAPPGVVVEQGALKEIWNGFRMGTASVADSLDALTNVVASATGWTKGEAFSKVRDYMQPTPEEIADKRFGPALARAIGAAVPIIAEFAIGTKGAGMALKAARLPMAVKGIATAPVAAFAGIEGLTTAGRGGTWEDIGKATAKGTAMGLSLGAAGMLPGIIHAPAVAGVFGGMAAIEGADAQEVMIQSLVGLGFGAHGAWKSSKGVKTMRAYLKGQGQDAAIVDKMTPGTLRKAFSNQRKADVMDFLQKRGAGKEDPEAFYNTIEKMSDENINKLWEKEVKEELGTLRSERNKVQQEYLGNPTTITAGNKKRYVEFLGKKGFVEEEMEKLSTATLSKLSMNPDPTQWKIDPIGDKALAIKGKKGKATASKTNEELQKEATTAPDKATREKAQAAQATKEVDAEAEARAIEADFLKQKEQGVVKDEDKIRSQFSRFRSEVGDDMSITPEKFEELRNKYGIAEEDKAHLAEFLKSEGFSLRKSGEVSDKSMMDFIRAEKQKDTTPMAEDVVRLPSRVNRAIRDKEKKLLTREEWDVLTDEDRKGVEEHLDIYYKSFDMLRKDNELRAAWNTVKKNRPTQKGREPKELLSNQKREILRKDIKAAHTSIRSYLKKSSIKLAAETKRAIGKEKKEKLKTPMLKISKSAMGRLEKLGWSPDTINSLRERADMMLLIKEKRTPDNTIIEEGRIVSKDKAMQAERRKLLSDLVKGNAEDDVIRELDFTQEEIDVARGVVETPMTTEVPEIKAPTNVPKEAKPPTKAPKPVAAIKEAKPAKRGRGRGIKSFEEAELVFDKYKEYKEQLETGQVERRVLKKTEGKYGEVQEGIVGQEAPAEAELISRIEIAKEVLEDFVGKNGLSDEQLEEALLQKAAKESGPTLSEIRDLSTQEFIAETEKAASIPIRSTGERDADELLAKAYSRPEKLGPAEEAKQEFENSSERLIEHGNQMARLQLALGDKNLDPELKALYNETLEILRQELPSISREVEAFRQTYEDLRPKEEKGKPIYTGPRPEEVLSEKVIMLDDGTGGRLVSEGGHGVDRFYILQDPVKGAPEKGAMGNKITIEARVEKDPNSPEVVKLVHFRSDPDINPAMADKMLSEIIEKYMHYGKEHMRKVERVPGVADSLWEAREDIEGLLRPSLTKTDKQVNANEDIKNHSKAYAFVSSIGKGLKQWKEGYEQRNELLESLSMLKSAADPQQFDPANFRAQIMTDADKMLGLVELLGDPTQSKIPMVRYAAQKLAQSELQIQYLTNHYINKFADTFSIFKNKPELQTEFWNHVHKNKISTNPEILDSYVKYRTIMEDIASVLKAKEKGWYISDYGTIRYNMNAVYDILGQPIKMSNSYGGLPDKIKNTLPSDAFDTAKEILSKYKTWDQMPKPSQDWMQKNVFSFNGVWSNWAYLPEFLQRAIPKKLFVANMQARTAGDSLKAALDYDFFDITRSYVLQVVRGGLMNDAIAELRPMINSLPNASQFGSVRSYLEKYVKAVAGTKPTIMDPFWNNIANRVNEGLGSTILPLYAPTTVAKEYIPLLYRGLLGVDTAFRNLTQTIYTTAQHGPSATLKGVLRYVDGRKNKSPEYKQFKEMIDLPDEFLEIAAPALPKREKQTWTDRVKYVNHKLTRYALSPMRVTENINKGIAYFAGMESALKKGYDFDTAHIVGTAKASQVFDSLALSEGNYKALRDMYASQFGYTSAHTSPYLQGAGIKMFTPFWSFPIKTAQLMWNNLLVNPTGAKSVIGKSDYSWYRFMALAGFMASAPLISSNLFGVDTYNLWGKGLFPTQIYPAWYSTMGNIYQVLGGDIGEAADRERAKTQILRFMGQITIPGHRWLGKLSRDYFNAERGYREYGREQRPIAETSYLDEFWDLMGFPPARFREAQNLMKEYKDEKFRNMVRKHTYLYEAVDAMEEKDYAKSRSIIREAKEKYNLTITPTEIQQAIDKKKDDIWIHTMTSAPKSIREKPEFQQKMGEARQKLVPNVARSYGTKPMWSSLSETIEASTPSVPSISLEE